MVEPDRTVSVDGWGVVGIVGLKIGAVVIALASREFVNESYRSIVAALAIPWSAAGVVYLYLLTMVIQQ